MAPPANDEIQTPAAAPTDRAIVDFIRAAGLVPAGASVALRRMTGGVSSDIWLAEAAGRSFCVKRALPQLRVATPWFAPVGRNANEAAWFKTVAAFLPEAAPAVLAEDAAAGFFAMQYLPPADYANWKAQLSQATVSLDVPGEVGNRLGRIHSVTAKSPALAARFASDDIFHAIRLEPYLLATAKVHVDLAGRLKQLATTTAATKYVLVHGDVSPKNIMIGPRGPVFIDAECAWWGDPAFDVAFCLKHFLLKCLWVPQAKEAFIAAYKNFVAAHLAHVDWEPPETLERRTSHLLPGLFLARVDGKSPVEYVTDESDKNRVRKVASRFLREPVDRLAIIADAWLAELN